MVVRRGSSVMVSIPTAAPSAYFPSADSYNNNMETSNNDHDLDNCAEPPSSLPYFANPSRHEFATASSSTSPTSNRVVDSSRSLHGPGHGQVQLNPRSCVTCRRRKVRCDKTIPCANCIKVGVECVFPAPGRAPRKSKRPSETQLLDRLKRLEGVIDQLRGENGRHPSVNVDAVAGIPATKKSPTIVPALLQPQPSALKDATSSRESQTEKAGCLQGVMGRDFRNLELRNLGAEVGRLVIDQGRSRYVSHKLWESLGDEVGIVLRKETWSCYFANLTRLRNYRTFWIRRLTRKLTIHPLTRPRHPSTTVMPFSLATTPLLTRCAYIIPLLIRSKLYGIRMKGTFFH